MFIKHITIRNLGAIDRLSLTLTRSVNVIPDRVGIELAYAIEVITNRRPSLPLFFPLPGENTRIEARVSIAGTEYRLAAKPDSRGTRISLHAYDSMGRERTQEYRYATSHCVEQDLCEVFDADARACPFMPIRYLDEDRYYLPNELSECTDRLSDTKAFRTYLKAFIKGFEPETLRNGKCCELCLKKDGRHTVRYCDDHGIPACLSESEQRIFRYLCFLKTAEFWQGFEELRNLNAVKKPILILHFPKRHNESIDVQELLERTRQLDRQVIIWAACN